MRAIKFKAYDTIQKKWLEPMDKLTICDETDFAWSYLTGSNGNAFIVFNDVAPWIKIVEFTGLKDKSGREIYEGDIVTVDRKDSFDKYNEAVIVFGVGSFLLEYTRKAPKGSILIQEATIKSDDTTVYDRITSWDIEVIGTIYDKENPCPT